MGKARAPRHGSMQVWPRKRSKRPYARVRSWAEVKEAMPLGFAGYKVGMTHIIVTDNKKTTKTKGMQISVPVTVIECPPMKVFSIKAYKKSIYGDKLATEVVSKVDKDLKRKLPEAKKLGNIEDLKAEDYKEFRLTVQTQPKLTGIGKKKPEVFELAIGGNTAEQLEYAKSVLGKEIHVSDIFNSGEQVDIHAVTRGKGIQGPVRRFGIKTTSHKSEKSIRTPGSLGGWKGHGGWQYRVAQAGQTGYHTRTDYNKWLMNIDTDPSTINVEGGYVNYGVVKNTYILLKGSIAGHKKRLIKFTKAIRPAKNIPNEAPSIEYISTKSKQGR